MPKSPPIHLVVFDLDDTLFRESDYARSGFHAVAGLLCAGDARDTKAMADWMWSRYRRGLRQNMFDQANRHFRLGLTKGQIGEVVDAYRLHMPAIKPCRGIVPLLKALRRKRFKIALLSDGYLPAQRLKFHALGLRDYFDYIVFTEDFGREAWKPSPKGFLLLQKHFSLAPEACAYVGDNVAKDFIAPNRLGWLTILWRRGGGVYAGQDAPPAGRPARVIRSGPQLLRLLNS